MRRSVQPDFEFDKDKFAELLQKAKGLLSLNDFAGNCECISKLYVQIFKNKIQ